MICEGMSIHLSSRFHATKRGKSARNSQNYNFLMTNGIESTLHLAIPALESLHAVWTKRSDDPEFSRFHNALGQALAKVDEYYNKTSNSNSYMFAMVLDPRKKLSHFKKHWPAGLQDAALADMEETFKQRYYEIQNTATTTSTAAPATRKPKASNARARRELTPEEEDDSALAATHLDTSQPWKDEFTAFLAVCETVPAGMSTIEWWGRNYQHYPVWGSLAPSAATV
ncbi:hypothetical protein B0H10DRAFT_1204461 [Mycena sp. CBHHK59/15]|nr:hypothetical protein B0H10DRAFT_814926 [Mycena sp. CBHHK59/15]KAJ6618966.1 hypothetical protein B0H10DRAFT_1204461 [Mycena sp. CBHHK59/15]